MTHPQVLRWFGYYKEGIPESRLENHRIRKVVIHYYLDNDTQDVVEPKEPNSGLPQVQAPIYLCIHIPNPCMLIAMSSLQKQQANCRSPDYIAAASCTPLGWDELRMP